MIQFFNSRTFPAQKVSSSKKSKPEWYANCIDYVIDAGLSMNDRTEAEIKLNILHGNIPNSYYKKTLNPYNSNKERYMRFPATMRNLDIMSDIVRRYVSEYFRGVHEFVVGANSPDIVLRKEMKLREQIMIMAQQAFVQEFQKRYQAAIQQGTPEDQINPEEIMPDQEAFLADFEEKYIDDASKQGQDLLEYIKSMTDDTFIYQTAFFNFVALGECYTYSEVRDNNFIKEVVPVIEAFPIPNNNYYVEDHDMFARRMLMSYQQIMDNFDEYLTERDRKYLDTYFNGITSQQAPIRLTYEQYFETYPDVCEKFTKEDREFFKKSPITVYDGNTSLYEVWHVVWRGEAKRGILQFVNEAGMIDERVVDEGYKLNEEQGDIHIEWIWEPQVYEGYRIGNRHDAVYPIKARAIAFNRGGKLPYNGIMEVLPMMGKFSIIDTITPFQVLRNIISYHREMVIAKNKMLLLLMPQSLLEDDAEDRIYKMAADGVLLYDDSEDTNSLKAQQIRLLNANMGDYIKQLTELIESIKYEARELVDMNQQRYGQIAQSAGATTTQAAISQSAMGSVIINEMFDLFRCKDYNRDLDYAKLAYIDGLDTSYFDAENKQRFLSLDVDTLLNSNLSTIVKNNAKELDKINQLKQWAFSAAQNGELDMAIAAITSDNVSTIKNTVNKFMEIRRQHEEQMKQIDQQLKQQEIQNKLLEIQAKGEEDRKTEELKYQYELQLKYVDVDVSLMGSDDSLAKDKAQSEARIKELTETNKLQIARDKNQIEIAKIQADLVKTREELQVKREQMDNDLKIARENKNKYDK